MKILLLPFCFVLAFITQAFPQDFTGDLPHIPVICVSRFNPESEIGKQIYERLKNLGADVLLIPQQGLDDGMLPFGKASIINLTLSDSSHQFDITRYVDAAYSVWEAEGGRTTDNPLNMVLDQTIGVRVPDSGYVRTRGTMAGTLLRGPGYRQKFIYDSYGEPDRSPMLYTAAFFLKLEIEPGIKPDSSEVLAELQVAVRHRQNPDSLIVLDQRSLTYEDFLRADTDGWFAMRLMYHLDTLRADAGEKWTDMVEFPVLWKGKEGVTLYVDKIVVSEPRGFSLAHDPMVREYFVDVFRDQKNSYLLDKWFAMPRPSFTDSQFPYNTIDSLANLAVTLRNEDRLTDIPRPISSVLYLNMREMESGAVIEPLLYPESDNSFSAATAISAKMSAADRLLRTVNTGLLYSASQIWIDAGLLTEEETGKEGYDSVFLHSSESMTLMRETIIPRLKGEFGRRMKQLKNPRLTVGKKMTGAAPLQLGAGMSALSLTQKEIDFGVYPGDTAGGSSFLYAVNNETKHDSAGDSISFSVLRGEEPYQNYLIRNILTGESQTVLKDTQGGVNFASVVPAGDARLFEVVPAATYKGKKSFLYDEQLTHDLLINRGDTLIFHAGITVTMKNGTSIRNSGTLIVDGTQDSVSIDFLTQTGKNGIYNSGALLLHGGAISNGVYGIVHSGGTLQITSSSITACGTGLLLDGSEPTPNLVELNDCLLAGNTYGLLTVNSTVSLKDVITTQNRYGISVTGNSILISESGVNQSASKNLESDVLVSNSVAYFGKAESGIRENALIEVADDALFIDGSNILEANDEPMSLIQRALQSAIAGDTTESVRICNELWGRYPETELAALSTLVVRYASSRQRLQQFPVFLEVLSGSAYASPLRLSADLIVHAGSLSGLQALQERYTEPEFQEKILFILFIKTMLHSPDNAAAEGILVRLEKEFQKSPVTRIAKTLFDLQSRR